MSNFEKELTDLINRRSVENQSDTPDYMLAEYLIRCLENWNHTVKARDKWFDFKPFSDSGATP